MKNLYQAQSGHVMCLVKVENPNFIPDEYDHVYAVRNWDADGPTFFYVCTGYQPQRCRQVHVFYPNGQMWSSFGENIQAAIDGAQRDGWLYTRPELAMSR